MAQSDFIPSQWDVFTHEWIDVSLNLMANAVAVV